MADGYSNTPVSSESTACRVRRHLAQMKDERRSYEDHYRELAEFILPRKSRWQRADKSQAGQKKGQRIINGSATYASRTFASGMRNGAFSPARPWFRFMTPDPAMMEYGPVKQWLYIVETRMRDILQRSNFYTAGHSVCRELGVFGTAPLFCDADMEAVVRFYPYTVGTYWIATGANGKVDAFAREFSMTVRQIVQKFGLDRCSQSTKSAFANGNLEQSIDVTQYIARNQSQRPDRQDRAGMAYESCYIEEAGQQRDATDTCLAEQGYHEFPVPTPRWDLITEDVYGSSPGMDALADIKQLQFNEKRKATLIDKIADPPMVAVAGMKSADTLPGGVTYVAQASGQYGFYPAYQPNGQALPAIREDTRDIEERVKQAFYEDLFLMLASRDGPEMTAEEVATRQEEKLMALGPALDRLNDELLDGVIDRTFSIMLRHPDQLVPPPPPELQGVQLRVQYISILAQAQRLVSTSGMDRTAAFLGRLAEIQMTHAPVCDKFDFDQNLDEYAQAQGVPPSTIRPDDAVEELRASRQQQEQAAQMAQMAPAAKQGADAAAALSKAQVAPDNLLGAVANVAGSGALAGMAGGMPGGGMPGAPQ